MHSLCDEVLGVSRSRYVDVNHNACDHGHRVADL